MAWCSVGLDMIAIPGDIDAETLAALIADEVAMGVINHKTTAVRVIPIAGKKAGTREAVPEAGSTTRSTRREPGVVDLPWPGCRRTMSGR